MPFGDGTGPQGMGPMTGWGAGYCTGYNRPGFAGLTLGRRWFGFNRYFGRGGGRGRGRGLARSGFNRFMPYSRW
jgi:hypothetical protein